MNDITTKEKLRRLFLIGIAILLLIASPTFSADYYILTITRKDTNWYKVENVRDTFLKTKYCYEYVYWEECILEVGTYGMRIKINSLWYDVDGIYAKVDM